MNIKGIRKFISIMLVIALSITSFLGLGVVSPVQVKAVGTRTIILHPTDDLYIQGYAADVNKSFNTGSLTVKEDGNYQTTRRSFLKFNLNRDDNGNPINGTITSAKLKLTRSTSGTDVNNTVYVYGIADSLSNGSPWTESTLNWNNNGQVFTYPGSTDRSGALASVSVAAYASAPNAVYSWDLTAYAVAEKNGDGIASLALIGPQNGKYTHFYSMNNSVNTDYRPYLELTINDSAPPIFIEAVTSGANKIATLTFSENLLSNVISVRDFIYLSTQGDNFLPLSINDTVTINSNQLVISLQNALSGQTNRIKILGGTLKDQYDNVLVTDLVTPNLDLDLTAPSYTGVALDSDFKGASLSFSENIFSNIVNLKDGISVSYNGNSFSSLSVLDSVYIKDNMVCIRLSGGFSGVNNRIKIASYALKDRSENILDSEVTTTALQGATLTYVPHILPSHPRLIANSNDFVLAANKVVNETRVAGWYEQVKADADLMLTKPVNSFTAGSGYQSVARDSRKRIYKLSFMYRMEKVLNPLMANTYAERAWQELNAVCNWPNWNETGTGGQFLDTAETMDGVAIGYDWLYDYLNESQRAAVRYALKAKGLDIGIACYNGTSTIPTSWWTRDDYKTNWVFVCDASMGMAALALGSDDPAFNTDVDYVIQKTFSDLPKAINDIAPDGGWSEGVTYWNFGMGYLFEYFSGLDTALYNSATASAIDTLQKAPGVSDTWEFPVYMRGPLGKDFVFGDGDEVNSASNTMFYMAKKYNKPYASWFRLPKADEHASEMDILWYDPAYYADPIQAHGLSLDKKFGFTEVTTMRGDWEDTSTTFVGFKGGEFAYTDHRDLDQGTFVLDALGYRWAEDLGKDSYALPNFFSTGIEGGRWDYYRKKAEGHNTLVVNPDAMDDQYAKPTNVRITATESSNAEAFAITDMTQSYAMVTDAVYNLTSVKRGIYLFNERKDVLIQDEIKGDNVETYWFMHTKAGITLSGDKQSAFLTQGTKRLWAKILSPSGVEFSVLNAAPLSTSPNPAGQASNASYKKLTIHGTGLTNPTFAVILVPLNEGDTIPAELPLVKPLADWHVTSYPMLTGLSINGAAVDNFNAGKYTYNKVLSIGENNIPFINAIQELGATVDIIQATSVPGTATARVSKNGLITEYKVSFTKEIPKLSGITVGGAPLSGFSPDVYTYNYQLPDGYTALPVLNATAQNSSASVSLTHQKGVSGAAAVTTIHVFADEKGIPSSLDYTVVFNYPTIPVAAVAADNGPVDGANVAANTLDGSLSTRWSAALVPGQYDFRWIQYDLGEVYIVGRIGLAFYNGHQRATRFDVDISEDGVQWINIGNFVSCGTTSEIEYFNLGNVLGRYIKVVGYGNNSSNASAAPWNSISEVTLKGAKMADKTVLAAEIAEAQSMYDTAVEGREPGKYPPESKAMLLAAINNAQVIFNNPNVMQMEVDEALVALSNSMAEFEASLIKDTTKPILIYAATNNKGNKIILQFSEALDAGLLEAGDFKLFGTKATVKNAMLLTSDTSGKTVKLILKGKIKNKERVTICISEGAVKDISGNLIEEVNSFEVIDLVKHKDKKNGKLKSR